MNIPKKLKDDTDHTIFQSIYILLRKPVGDKNCSKHIGRNFARIEYVRGKIFQSMIDIELFNPTSHVLVDCQRSCFIVFLLKELKETASEKNEHIIGESMKRGPSGRPDTNYFLAHHYNYIHQKMVIFMNFQQSFRRLLLILQQGLVILQRLS